MTTQAIEDRLEKILNHHTTTVNGFVVTRRGFNFEINRISGKIMLTLEQAIEQIKAAN